MQGVVASFYAKAGLNGSKLDLGKVLFTTLKARTRLDPNSKFIIYLWAKSTALKYENLTTGFPRERRTISDHVRVRKENETF